MLKFSSEKVHFKLILILACKCVLGVLQTITLPELIFNMILQAKILSKNGDKTSSELYVWTSNFF